MTKQEELMEIQINSFLDTLGYNPEVNPTVDMFLILRRYGFSVGITDETKGNLAGFIAVKPKSQFENSNIVCVHRSLDFNTRSFVQAHEFLYYIVNYNGETRFLHKRIKGITDDLDPAARALIMPTRAILHVYNRLNEMGTSRRMIIWEISRTFHVNEDMVSMRLSEMGLGY